MELREILRNKPKRKRWDVILVDINYPAEKAMIEGEQILIHPVDVIGSYIMGGERYYEFNVMDLFWDHIPFEGTFLDVGANIGNHTLMFNRFRPNVHIHSFEPVYKNYVLLYENSKSKPNITTYPVGLGNSVEAVKVFQPHKNNRGGITIDNDKGDETVTIIPGDSLKLDNVTFIKIDVEGYEIGVLVGLYETINKYNPTIWIEDFTGEAVDWLKQNHKYEVVMDDGGYGNYLMALKQEDCGCK